ncbi:MAG TPA: hypothetical protein VK014_15185 [Cyclobacteriaceae bacterium]|nr:hypothetical protein [Cyclobacteriaceae bacterium]
MIVCKPKISTYFSLGVVVVLLVAGLMYILNDFATKQSFGLWFYLVSCSIITVVLLMLLVKMMANYRFLTVKKNNIMLRIPLKGLSRTYPLSSIKAWQEEVIMANKKEFRQLTILFDDHASFSLSNQEHTSYSELIKLFKGKLAKKKVE